MPKSDYSYSLRLKILDKDKFFGLGVAELLENVDETHSLLQASKNMSMAYTKALKIIKRAESALGYKLLLSKTGGKSGGGSYLTDNAHSLLKSYREFEKKVSAFADTEFEIFLNEIDKLS